VVSGRLTGLERPASWQTPCQQLASATGLAYRNQTLKIVGYWPTAEFQRICQRCGPAVQLPLSESTPQVVVIRKGDRALLWKARGSPFRGRTKNWRPPRRTDFSCRVCFHTKTARPLPCRRDRAVTNWAGRVRKLNHAPTPPPQRPQCKSLHPPCRRWPPRHPAPHRLHP
jgi:hypothetical protein